MKTEELKALLGCMDAEVNGIWPLEYEDSYFVPSPVSITGWALLHWNDSTFDRRMLDARIVFTKAEDAQKLLQLQLKAPELAAEVIQLREAQRWIPVSERLPDDGVRVLVLDTNSEINVCSRSYWQNGLYLWDYAYFDRFHADKKVTHWMPVPVLTEQNVSSAEEAFGGAL